MFPIEALLIVLGILLLGVAVFARLNENDLLSSFYITGMMQGLQDPRLMEQPLTWNTRIPDVPAVDDEIFGYWQGQPLVADIVADDAAARIYSYGRFAFESTKIPNIKMGIGLTQTQLNFLAKLRARQTVPNGEMEVMQVNQARHLAAVLYGVQVRKEIIKIGMLMDGLSYDRLGIRLTGVTWGMPSDLKVVPSVAWTSSSATPLTDINTVRRIARQRYGMNLNRATMSTAALQAIAGTTEFQNQAKIMGWPSLFGAPAPTIPLQLDGQIAQMLNRMLSGADPAGGSFTIEIDDRRYWTADTAGAQVSVPFQPINVVILTDSGNDGNATAYDFANAVVSEGLLSQIVGGQPGVHIAGAIPAVPGPVGYVTLANGQLNPPGMVTWGVARGFARKFKKAASATLTVGNLTDPVTLGVASFV